MEGIGFPAAADGGARPRRSFMAAPAGSELAARAGACDALTGPGKARARKTSGPQRSAGAWRKMSAMIQWTSNLLSLPARHAAMAGPELRAHGDLHCRALAIQERWASSEPPDRHDARGALRTHRLALTSPDIAGLPVFFGGPVQTDLAVSCCIARWASGAPSPQVAEDTSR